MKNRIMAMLLVGVLALSVFACAAVAEEAIAAETEKTVLNLTDSTLYVGGKSYAFPASVAELTEMGVEIPDVTDLTEGLYYPAVEANDGRNGFELRVEYLSSVDDPFWVTGVHLNSDDHAGMSVGGLVLGETTRGEIIAALGSDYYGDTYGSDELTYYAYNFNYKWYLTFDGRNENAKLIKLNMDSSIVSNYGIADSDKAGVEEADLPDVSTMGFKEFILDGKYYAKGASVQNLLDNGWVLSVDKAEKTVSPMTGGNLWLYNGASMIRVGAYNLGETDCTYADCVIDSVYADVCNKASIVCADGLANGVSTYDEALALLGEPGSIEDGDDGFKNVTFTVINDVRYTIGVNADGGITYITINNLI